MLALVLMGCTSSSTLDLTLFVSEDALHSIPEFPVQVIVDLNRGGVYDVLSICSRPSGFLEAHLDTPEYLGCQEEPKLLRAAIISSVSAETCVDGQTSLTKTFPDSRLFLAYGEEPIFETGICGVEEQTTLVISAL